MCNYCAKRFEGLSLYKPSRDLSILILRAKYEMAIYSVEDKRAERYRETVDEYYAFKNEFPESKYMKEADRIFKDSEKILNEDKQS